MAVRCDIIVKGSTVVFECEDTLLGTEPQALRGALESHVNLERIPDGSCIGTAAFPTETDSAGNTSFSIDDEYKKHSILF